MTDFPAHGPGWHTVTLRVFADASDPEAWDWPTLIDEPPSTVKLLTVAHDTTDNIVRDPDRRAAAIRALAGQDIQYPGERLIHFADSLLMQASDDYDGEDDPYMLAEELASGTGGGQSTEGVMRLLAESAVLASTEPEEDVGGSPAAIGRLVVHELATRILDAEITRLREESQADA